MWTMELFNRTRLGEVLDGTKQLTKEYIIEYAERHGAPRSALDMLNELDDDELYEVVTDIWPDMPTLDDEFGYDKDE